MLHIQCAQCGATLMGKDVNMTIEDAYIDGIKYKNYAASCNKCGGAVVHERLAQMTAKSKAKAMAKLAKRKKKTVKQISEEEQYTTIMCKAGKRARELAELHPVNPAVRVKDFYAAVDELPKEEKQIVLTYEDKMDMQMLKNGASKPASHIKPNAILLLTQGIIESAIAEKDEDFFQSQYGAQIVDTYNTALTAHTSNDYGITARFLLEKMRKRQIKVKGEQDDE